jgi:prepilin-type N-terminal cleavage/methylation domain-containing protein
MKTKPTNHIRKPAGFSLVELLVTIGVIGMLAAIVIPAFSNVNESSSITAAQKQAQGIAEMFNNGRTAGAASFRSADSVASAMNAVGEGAAGGGVLSQTVFQLKGVSSGMDFGKPLAERASTYLNWDNGILVYDPTGSNAGWGEWSTLTSASSEARANQMVQEAISSPGYNPNVEQYRYIPGENPHIWLVQSRTRNQFINIQ